MSPVNFDLPAVRQVEKLLDLSAEQAGGVEIEWKALGDVCKIDTGKLNANAAVDDGAYMFFTTAKETSKIDKYRWDAVALLIPSYMCCRAKYLTPWRKNTKNFPSI